jgi:hypothetical protein
MSKRTSVAIHRHLNARNREHYKALRLEAEDLGDERQVDVELGLEVDEAEDADQLERSPTSIADYSQRSDDGERDAELRANRKQRLQVHVQLDEQRGEERQLGLSADVDREEDSLRTR